MCGCCPRSRSTCVLGSGSPSGVWKMWGGGGERRLHFADLSASWIVYEYSEQRQYKVCSSQGSCSPPSPSPVRSWHLLYCCTQPPAGSACWHYAQQLWTSVQGGVGIEEKQMCSQENKVTRKGLGAVMPESGAGVTGRSSRAAALARHPLPQLTLIRRTWPQKNSNELIRGLLSRCSSLLKSFSWEGRRGKV